MTPPHQEQQDFRTFLRTLWRWKFLVLALLIVVPAISYLLEARKERQYQSSTLVQLLGLNVDSSLFAQSPTASSLKAVARLVQTSNIANAAGKLMDPPQPGGGLLGKISVAPDTDTGFLTITATDTDPRRAAQIANAFSLAISSNRAAAQIAQLNSRVAALKRQLDSTDRRNRSGRNDLREQIESLRGVRAAAPRPDAAIIERAVPSATPLGRNTRRAIELGIVIALLLAVGAVALAENSDRRIRSPEELEELTGLPLLSTIPTSAFSSLDGDEEAFQMLRSALTYFNVDRRLASVVIASAAQEDGKTTVAMRLAFSLARAGKRVILVDADLRHPNIGPRLGIETSEGLASVVVGERQLFEVLTTVTASPGSGDEFPESGSLRVLPAGAAPPNPAELLSAPALRQVLTDLEARADIVVVDSAAALAVSDALPLLQAASGVVFVVRINRSTRAAIRRLQSIVASAKGTALGVVATGSNPREHGYGYGYDYAEPKRRGRRAARKAQSADAPHVAATPPRDPVDA